MTQQLNGNLFCRCRPRERLSDWELEAEREYFERCLAETREGTDSYVFLASYRDAVADELDRRKIIQYPRARRGYGDLKPVVAEIRERADLIALFDRHCERRRTVTSLTPKSVKYRCFLHDDHEPSLTVWPEKGRWWCFPCNQGGDVITALMKLENLPFVAAVERLAAECGLKLPEAPKRLGVARLGAG